MLERGMKVFLLVRGVDDHAPPKRRPAKIIEVMRGAARIAIEGEKERVVKLSFLEIDMEAYNARAMRRVAGTDGVPEIPQHREQHREPPRPPTPIHVPGLNPAIPSNSHLKNKVEDDLETWLNMGRELLAPIKGRCAQIEESLRCLADEKAAIDDEMRSLKEELDGLNAKQRVINGKVHEMERS
jgi:hypothetical protein